MVKNIPIVFFIALTSVLAVSCSPKEVSGKLIVTEITESGTDGGKQEFCSDFALSKKAAEAFFEQAKPVTAEQFHNNYVFLPCYTRGKATIGGRQCLWEIRAGNTGELTCGGKATKLFACDDCLATP